MALSRRRKEAERAEARAIKERQKRLEWEANGSRLTREEVEAGVPCRGCGLLVQDGKGGFPALLYMTVEQRAEYDAADAEYRQRHADCEAGRWSVSGSNTTHCGYCCPPPPWPPLSEEQLQRVIAIFKAAMRRDRSELDVWELTLTCGHAAEALVHPSNMRYSGSVEKCDECQELRGVVTAERTPPDAARHRRETQRPSVELEQARAAAEKTHAKAAAADRKLGRLQAELDDLGPGA